MSPSSSQRNQQQQEQEQRPLPHDEPPRPQHGRTSWKDLRLGEEALGGLSAGIVGTVIGFPLDTVKTRMQTGASVFSATKIIPTATHPPVPPPSPPKNNHSIYQIARSIVKQEGFLSLYKGIGPPLLSLSILGTLTFTQYSYFQDYFQATPGWDGRNFLAGISCSPLAGMISTVENLVKTQMQMDNIHKKEFQSSLHCVKTLIQRHGLQIVYTGHGVNTLREATFLGHYFFMYEGLREFFLTQFAGSAGSSGNNHNYLPQHVAIPLAGGCAGAFAWFVSFPLDCIRAGVQGQSLQVVVTHTTTTTTRRKGLLSPSEVFQNLIQTRGIRGLYSGASASILRAFLVSGSRFSAYEMALVLLRGGRKNYD